ncbi:MAG TPA: energy transducer TonB, partial [Thermoanaerobaculia bacterium]
AVAPAAPIPATAPAIIPSTIAPVEPIGDAPASDPSTIGVPWGSKNGVKPDGPPVPADAARPLPVGNGVTAPVALRRVEPLYPPLAVRARMSGSVLLQCIIDKSGRIRDVHVVSSTFSAFEQPAIDAVQQWLFAPGTLKGEPVDTIFELTVRFQVK